ncbi:MAG: metallophosphoesterase [Gammaproteobacteria bacterium]|nr:metallophosphoesterase [Gammaproteobacteria bacterium]
MSYDIIGDIHGCSGSLVRLLETLGYAKVDGVYRHPSRLVAFLGDFIDRGPDQRGVINIVRPMIKSGAAVSVMGNHEFNAIAYYSQRGDGRGYLREHSEKNYRQHEMFLNAYEPDLSEYADVIAWFKTLPLWLDLDGFRLIHACWDESWINRIKQHYGSILLSDALLDAASRPETWEFEAVETLLKGKEIPLSPGNSFQDKDGNERHHIRIRWWDGAATTYRQAFFGPESASTHIPDDEVDGDHLLNYSHHEPPVFMGHYWLEGQPQGLAGNIACLDYSVAKPGGKLVAYRWDGESTLSNEKFVWVDRQEK